MHILFEKIKEYNFLHPQIEKDETFYCTITYCNSDFIIKNVGFYIIYNDDAEEICNTIIKENFPDEINVTDVSLSIEKKNDYISLSGQKPSLKIETFKMYI